ncbi:hypothetical protein L798_01516 [Zootermopsis nevadensis]|uniref:Methyltransferase domain-containing protein n=1 Tax=Zootermopsis nevadensis TaxID=136037 RepID=A0A067QW80_ZOONE|nr:hypothetical protein L798_01516 [Zootermopsis nevadensis]
MIYQKMPNVLCHRANIFKQGNSQPWRGKHRKSQISTKILEGRGCNSAESGTTSKPQSQNKVTAFVTQQRNLCSLVKEHFQPGTCQQMALSGLHTCGDLAPDCCRLFASKEFSCLCNVRCCCHLLEEEYVRSPFWTDVDPPLPRGVLYGFPMSQFLHMQQFSLGRSARMLAAYSLDRIGESHQNPHGERRD